VPFYKKYSCSVIVTHIFRGESEILGAPSITLECERQVIQMADFNIVQLSTGYTSHSKKSLLFL